MPVATIGPSDALPRSHVFVSIAHGQTIRTIRLRRGVLHAGYAGATLLSLWLVCSSAYLVFHDDLVAALMARETATQYAYEDRIAALRVQVERESSLKLVGSTKLDGKLKELTQRAAALEVRAGLLSQLSANAGLGGMAATDATLPPSPAVAADRQATDTSATGLIAAPEKPHPEAENSVGPLRHTSVMEMPSFNIRVASVEERLERVDAAQFRTLGHVQGEIRHRADILRSAIQGAGLSIERLAARGPAPAIGGPFVPLDPAIMRSSFGQAVEALRDDAGTEAALVQAMPHLPFAKPLVGALEVTSPFGARVDPFLGRPAMHTGVDLKDSYGTEVRATADGRVVSAGPAGGYGMMIEIDHGHGLSTRYAHLSGIDVTPGQHVEKGSVIGDVGASGRATGPHLHYETRIDGEAVDPERFLMAGARLAAADIGL